MSLTPEQHHTQSARKAGIMTAHDITDPLYTQLRSMSNDDLERIANYDTRSLCEGCIEDEPGQMAHIYCKFACLQDTDMLDEEELADIHAEKNKLSNYAIEILAGRSNPLTAGPVRVLNTPSSLASAATEAVAAHANELHEDMESDYLTPSERTAASTQLDAMTGHNTTPDVHRALWYHGFPRYQPPPYEAASDSDGGAASGYESPPYEAASDSDSDGGAAAGYESPLEDEDGRLARSTDAKKRKMVNGGSRKRKRIRGLKKSTRRRHRHVRTRRSKAKGERKRRNTVRRGRRSRRS